VSQEGRRAEIAHELLVELDRAFHERAEWYHWVLNGCPRLSEEEYGRVGRLDKTKKKRETERAAA